MFIKTLVAFSGDPTCDAGATIDRPDDEAQRFIDAGFAKKATKAEIAAYQDALAEAADKLARAQELATKAEADRLAAEEAAEAEADALAAAKEKADDPVRLEAVETAASAPAAE